MKFENTLPRSKRVAGTFSWEGLLQKSLPNPLQKLLKQGLKQIKFQAALPRSERIADAVTFSNSFSHWLPQVLGTPAPKTPNRYNQTAHRSSAKTRSRSEHITPRSGTSLGQSPNITFAQAKISLRPQVARPPRVILSGEIA